MIRLDRVVPHPLKAMPLRADTQIWEKSIQFAPHQKHLIRATSGKGKSTFLHLIYGLRSDYDGTIFYDDTDIRTFTEDKWSSLRQAELSIVFQNLRLFPQLTARQNIHIVPCFSADISVDDMARQLGVGDLLDRRTDTLSFGQQQRVAILRALARPFRLLLLDEPFSHLDAENIVAARQLIQTRCDAQHAGFLLVSLGEDYGWEMDVVLDL